MFHNIQWLFFDAGSTLIDEESVYRLRFQEIASSANQPYDRVYETALEFYKQKKKGDAETAKLLNVPLPRWNHEYETLYPDAEDCLKKLHRQYKIGLIANQPEGTQARIEKFGILPLIDLIVPSAEESIAKPDKRIFEIALKRSRCLPSEAVMIGDRIDNDIVPAKALGMHTIWIRQGLWQHWKITLDSEMPDHTVFSLSELTRTNLFLP